MKFIVRWKENSTINNIVEVEATTKREAVKKVFPNKKFRCGYGHFMIQVSDGKTFSYFYEVKNK